jgi:hypothetical protein
MLMTVRMSGCVDELMRWWHCVDVLMCCGVVLVCLCWCVDDSCVDLTGGRKIYFLGIFWRKKKIPSSKNLTWGTLFFSNTQHISHQHNTSTQHINTQHVDSHNTIMTTTATQQRSHQHSNTSTQWHCHQHISTQHNCHQNATTSVQSWRLANFESFQPFRGFCDFVSKFKACSRFLGELS